MTRTPLTTASARHRWTPVVVMLLTAAIASPTWAGPVRAASPLNDAFADAAVLSGPLPLAVTGSNVDATSEAGEPWHGTDAAASVWWSWTAPANGTLHVSACGSDFDTLLAVYTGTTLATLTQVAQNDDACDFQSEVLVRVDAGTTYAIAVDGFGGATGAIALALDLFAAPANDDFADARVLTGPLPITTTGSTEHASREAGEPEHGAPGYLGSASVWLSWTPAESGVVTIDLCDGSDFLTLLSVYVGDSLGALTQLGGNLYGCGPFSRLTLSAVAGTAYRIAIDGGFGDTGNYSLDIRPALALNDNFADATVLSGPLPIVAHGTNAGATNENGEPNGADPNPTETRWGPDSSVWYRWTAAATGPVSIETCGSEMDSVLAVYEGATLTGLTRVGWNSNACSVQSLLWVDAVAGHTYQIAVGTVAFEGAITLTIRVAGPPPANDGFADARRLPSALPILVNDSNYEATSQPGEPAHAGLTAAASVWYRWTPSRSQLVNIDTCASDSFKFLAVYSGDRLGALTEVAANHGPASYLCAGYGGVLRFPVIARTTYWIAVDGDRGSIALSLRPAVPPANDAFSAPVTLAGPLPLSTTATTTDATYEPSEPVDYTGQGRGASVWWSWTPSVSQVVAIETCEVGPASTMYSLVGVWTGSSVDALEQAPDQVINHCRYGTSITLPVEAGQTYRVSVDSFYYGVLAGRLGLPMDMEGTVPLTIRAVHPPTNDAFDARQVLTGPLPITITAANDDATAEPAEPGHDFLSNFDVPMRSVWYEWTATSTGRVIIESCDNPTDVVVGLYEGVGLGELTDLEGFELQTCPAGSRHPLDVVAGSTYLIAIDGGEGDQGPFTLTIRDADPPANDLMADAQVLTGALPIVAAGTTVDATVEPGEPDHSTGTRNGYETPTHSIWYSWTPDADEHVAIDTCPTDAFTRLVVFAGADPMTATEVGAGDFVCALESTVSLAAVGGTTYWIKVDGRDTGPISLRIRRHSPPVNDAFTGASDLGRRSQASVTTSRLDATAEPGEPRHGGLGAGQSVWFRWTAPSGGIVTIDTCGSDIHTMLGVYTGAAVDALTTIASGGDMACGLRGGSRLTFPVTARTTYRIAVDWARSLIDLPFNPGGMVSLHLQLEAGSGAAGSRTAPGGLPA